MSVRRRWAATELSSVPSLTHRALAVRAGWSVPGFAKSARPASSSGSENLVEGWGWGSKACAVTEGRWPELATE